MGIWSMILVFCTIWLGKQVDGLCNDTDIRLVNGTNQYEGRVEICFNDTWGTICDGYWHSTDANVACRQLGFAGTDAVSLRNAFFGEGTGPVYLDDFFCTGRETRLFDCRHGELNMLTNCRGHLDDAGVRCASGYIPCTNGDTIRLQGGNATSGRVEICSNNTWGTVCDDFWGAADAQVACRQLGFPTEGLIGAVPLFIGFANGDGEIWLDDVECVGTEASLTDCPGRTIGRRHGCFHIEDAGVRCRICVEGSLRLQDGISSDRGRVEICNNETWGTVCDDSWTSVEARVVCIQLGLPSSAAVAVQGSEIMDGTGEIWLDSVACAASDTKLTDCLISGFGGHNCTHNQDVGVICQGTTCTDGDIRLQGGNATEGRVEICYNNAWGSICDDGWGNTEAKVACFQLGLPSTTAIAVRGSLTEDGTGPIWLDSVRCYGNPFRIIDCRHQALGVNDCGHSDDAGVRCTGNTCPHGDIRLQGGPFEGRVEICNNHIWGLLCGTLSTSNYAEVACRQLGLPSTAAQNVQAFYFRDFIDRIYWFDNVLCLGNETRVIDCPATMYGSGHCRYSVGVACAATTCTQGDIRLQGGNATEGRVEICNNNIWGTVCNDRWGDTEARIACRQLGLPSSTATILTTGFDNGTGHIWLDEVSCSGTETRLIDCSSNIIGRHDCEHSDDVGVSCTGTMCVQGAIRLQGGTATYTGRVEICNNNAWGRVCTSGHWDNVDATVACRQLGLPSAAAAAITTGFVSGGGPVWMSIVQCTGNESRLIDCPANTALGPHTCFHQNVGVVCIDTNSNCSHGDIRLQGGTATSGRVEICNHNIWGTVCDDAWDSADARVACFQLGLPSSTASVLTSGFANGEGVIWLDEVFCRDIENRLIDCRSSGNHNCEHSDDAGVYCTGITCDQGSIRLQGESTVTQGRVEVCNNNVWGTVCDDFWDDLDAKVACRQLGLPSSNALALTTGFTDGNGRIWLDNVRCSEFETRLIDCPANPLGSHNCRHFDDAGVSCSDTVCTQGAIRLQGGSTSHGRVELCNNNVWGTVCDNLWGNADAKVACRQLGLPSSNAIALTTGFSNGNGTIWLDNVQCSGTETRLIDCRANSLGSHNCFHFTDAGVLCTSTTCTQGAIRLQGGTSTQGRVEICNNNVWGTVCDDLWGNTDARVACRQLGLPSTTATALTFGFTNGAGQIWLDNVQCRGTETRLIDCPANALGSHDCEHGADAGVRCTGRNTCTQGNIRLQGGPTITQGRVEICNNNVWGTVCNDFWGPPDAQVVCRQLGYSDSEVISTGFSTGIGQIWLDDVWCRGTETRLVDCPSNPLGNHNCDHSKDAGVRCEAGCTEGAITGVVTNALRYDPNFAFIEVQVTPNIDLNGEGYFEFNIYLNNLGNQELDLLVDPIRTFRKSENAFVLNALSTCQTYWITTTAVSCGSRVRSEAVRIDVHDPMLFTAIINVGGNGPCQKWTSTNLNQKYRDIQHAILEAFSDTCNYFTSCTSNITLSCLNDDANEIDLAVIVVGTDTFSSQDQVQCLTEWVNGDTGNGMAFSVGGDVVNIVSSDEPASHASGVTSTAGGWVITGVTLPIVIIIIIILAVVVGILVISKKKQNYSLQTTSSRRIAVLKAENHYENPAYYDTRI